MAEHHVCWHTVMMSSGDRIDIERVRKREIDAKLSQPQPTMAETLERHKRDFEADMAYHKAREDRAREDYRDWERWKRGNSR